MHVCVRRDPGTYPRLGLLGDMVTLSRGTVSPLARLVASVGGIVPLIGMVITPSRGTITFVGGLVASVGGIVALVRSRRHISSAVCCA